MLHAEKTIKTKIIINLWEDHVKSDMSSSGNPPDCAQKEIDTFLLNRKLETHEAEYDIVHDDVPSHQ